MDPPQEADTPPALPSPPAKRVKVDTSVTVNVGGENISISPSAFSRLETFLTEKINKSEKKARYHCHHIQMSHDTTVGLKKNRNPLVKKQEGQYEIKREAAEFQVLRNYLEGRPLSKIRDVDKKKKILKVRNEKRGMGVGASCSA
jgi:hypothetical protein